MDQDEKKQKESRETSSVGGSDANITRQLESIQEDIQQIKADISKLVMTKNSVNEGSKKGDESDVNIAGLAIGVSLMLLFLIGGGCFLLVIMPPLGKKAIQLSERLEHYLNLY